MKLPKVGDELDGTLRLGSMIRENAHVTSFDGKMIESGKAVAVSFLHVSPAQREPTRSFLESLLGRATLDDPSIARIVAVGAVGAHEGAPFIAIEEISGKDIDLIVAEAIESRRAIATERAVDITLGILRALQVAHLHGIAHWELSPWSVAIEDHGEGREATKVLDLGVAHAVRARLSPGATREAMRDDVRATAAILLELLTLPGSTTQKTAPALLDLAQASAATPALYDTATDLALALLPFASRASDEVQRRLRAGARDKHPALRSIPTSEETPRSRARA